ncbi:MAG: leucyl/phenylalanyl-tRNA--protein transferase [Chloroflexota bacterium]
MQNIQPNHLLNAYCQGVFPMADDDGTIYWYDPDPRAILPLDYFHIPRRLARTVKSGQFEVKFDTAFRRVMELCAAPRPGHDATWISDDIINVYTELHEAGFAHSVETWQGDRLVGGLYGVSICGLFAGESMFSRQRDASKVALVHLVAHLRVQGFTLLDTQFNTPHLSRFGVIEIPRNDYKMRLDGALRVAARF